MIFKAKTTVAWAGSDKMYDEKVIEAKIEKMKEFIDLKKTDGVPIRDEKNPLTVSLQFVDEESAQEWIDFLESITEDHIESAKVTSI